MEVEDNRKRYSVKFIHLVSSSLDEVANFEISLPGSVWFEKMKNCLWIKCADSKWIGCYSFRVSGKSLTYNAANFVNGYHLKNFQKYFD